MQQDRPEIQPELWQMQLMSLAPQPAGRVFPMQLLAQSGS